MYGRHDTWSAHRLWPWEDVTVLYGQLLSCDIMRRKIKRQWQYRALTTQEKRLLDEEWWARQY
jgi:hypothetical protein